MRQAVKGLEGLVVDETKISQVIPEQSELLYRGYPVAELAEKRSFEDVAYLLWEGNLASDREIENFKKEERESRPLLDRGWISLLELLKDSHPMDALRTLISFQGAKAGAWDTNRKEKRGKALKFLASAPVFVSAHFRLRKGLKPVPPDGRLSFSENFLKMCFDTPPSKELVRLFDQTMILYAEHGFNVSTFSARVIVSTNSDMASAVTGAIGALKGPLHGGANEKVMGMMKEIEHPKHAEEYLLKALKAKQKIMGFGHRVYKKQDSRVPAMEICARRLGEMKNERVWMEIYDILTAAMIREKGIYPNLDLPAGPAYYLMGFDIDMFTSLFVMSRMAGWTAHIMEQGENNRIIRPLSEYTGVEKRHL